MGFIFIEFIRTLFYDLNMIFYIIQTVLLLFRLHYNL